MKVEQENFLRAILRSLQRRRRRSGTSRCMARAKSAFMTMALALLHARRRAHADRAPAFEEHFLDGRVEADFHAEPLRDPRHRRGDGRAAADRMEDAVFVFEKREDREKARAAERRHAEVFRLKGERQADARVAEEAAEIGVQRLMRPEHRQHLQQARIDEVLPAEEGRLEARLHARELGAVLRPGSGGSPARRRARWPRSAAPSARCRAWRRISPPPPNMMRYCGSSRTISTSSRSDVPAAGEDFLQHPRVEEKRRAEVELEAVRLDRRSAPADGRQPLEDFHLHARGGEQDGGGEAAGAGADDDGIVFLMGAGGSGQNFVLTPQARSAHQPRAASKPTKAAEIPSPKAAAR